MIKAGTEDCDVLSLCVEFATEVVDKGAFQAFVGVACQVVNDGVEEGACSVRSLCCE